MAKRKNKLENDFDSQIVGLRTRFIKAILKDCDEHPDREILWAESLKNHLLPRQQEISGKEGKAILIKLDE